MKLQRYLLCSLFVLVTFLALPAAKADRYATLVSGGSITVADGETALVISCHNFTTANQSNAYTLGVILRYAPSGGGQADIQITPAGFVRSYTSTTVMSSSSAAGSGPSTIAPIPLVGPATISIPSGSGILGIRITSTEISDTSSSGGGGQPPADGTPSNAVVIPENSAGPVEIILESSTDLITWTAANPGSYGSSTEKRFFRVRAVENTAP